MSRAARRSARRQQRLLRTLAVLATVVVVGVGVTIWRLTRSGSTPSRRPTADTTTTTAASAAPSTTTTTAVADASLCPLTGEPVQGGVPKRPALAIKVGNNPGARPQSGLSAADVIFEVQVEGGITRFIAVYDCSEAPAVGPVRSSRWTDPHLLEQLGHPIFGFAGGINPDRRLIAASPLFDADFFRYYDSYYRISSRTAPNNLYVATKTLWALDPSHTPPPALFHYSDAVPPGEAVASVGLTYSSYAAIVWHWDATVHQWLRYYGTTPALRPDGQPQEVTNVVIEHVQTEPGPYVEDVEGAHGVHSITVGSGTAWVLRNGEVIKGRWVRPALSDVTQLLTASGRTITLAPGRTWVEILPAGDPVVLNP